MTRASISAIFACALISTTALGGSPAVKALAESSTDIVVVTAESTNPRKAVEGARDTVMLRVVRSLKGPRKEGDVIPLYYHLLWVDADTLELEPNKFEKGNNYLVFLKSQTVMGENEKQFLRYELTDQWLSVQPVHPDLEKEIRKTAAPR